MTKTTKKVLTVGCALTPFAFLLSILLPVFKSAHVAAVRSMCFSNMRTLATANLQYADAFDGRFPKADRWMDQVTRYVPEDKVNDAFHCPELDRKLCGYAMNSNIAGKPIEKIDNLSNTYLTFETDTLGRNVSGPPSAILTTPRHGTITVGFADGHAKYSRER